MYPLTRIAYQSPKPTTRRDPGIAGEFLPAGRASNGPGAAGVSREAPDRRDLKAFFEASLPWRFVGRCFPCGQKTPPAAARRSRFLPWAGAKRALPVGGPALALALACLGAPAILAGQSWYPEETFPELRVLLEQVLDEAPQVQLRQWRLREAEGGRIEFRGAARPQLNASARVGLQAERRDDLEGIEYNAGLFSNLTLTQSLYSWGAQNAREALGENRFQLAQASLREARASALQQVRDRFLDWIIARERTSLRKEGLELAGRLAATQERLFERGDTGEARLVEARIAQHEAEAQLLAARRDLEAIEAALADLVDRDSLPAPKGSLQSLDPYEETVVASLDSAAAQATPAATDPFFRVLSESIEAEAAQVDFLDAQDRPMVDLVASLFQDRIDVGNDPDPVFRLGLFGGIQVRWNLLDGGQTTGRRIAALARQRFVETQLRQYEREWIRETLRLLREVRFQNQRVHTADRRVDLLRNRLNLTESQAETGTVTESELLRQRIALGDARIGAIQARADLLKNASRLHGRLHGDPLLPQAED